MGSLGLYEISKKIMILILEEYKDKRPPKDIDIVIIPRGTTEKKQLNGTYKQISGNGVPSSTIETLYKNDWKLYNKDGSEVSTDDVEKDLMSGFDSKYGSFTKNGIELDLVKNPFGMKFYSIKNYGDEYENAILGKYEAINKSNFNIIRNNKLKKNKETQYNIKMDIIKKIREKQRELKRENQNTQKSKNYGDIPQFSLFNYSNNNSNNNNNSNTHSLSRKRKSPNHNNLKNTSSRRKLFSKSFNSNNNTTIF